ncbi:MAG: hypothetical protein GX896_03720, partial [Clostridiales bacterium]|nr:hypothetical protein [Clostridiales bacterium]
MQYNLVQFFGNISGIWTLSSTVLGIILTVVEYIFDKSKRKKMADKSKRKNMVGAFLCAITVSLAIVTFFSYWVEYHYSKVPNVIGATYDVAVQTLDEKSLICKRNDRIGVTDIVKTMS